MTTKTSGWVRVLYVLLAILYIIAGITIMANPAIYSGFLGVFLASMLLVYGAMMIITYFMAVNFKTIWTLILGVVMIVMGLIVMSNLWDAMNILGVFTGIAFIASGAFKVYQSFSLKEMGIKAWIWVLLLGICTLAVGCILCFNPSTSGAYLTLYVGISLLVNGVSDLFLGIFGF